MFAMGDTGGAQQCINITGMDDSDQEGNREFTITIQQPGPFNVDGSGSDFAEFVTLTIVDDDTGKSMCSDRRQLSMSLIESFL